MPPDISEINVDGEASLYIDHGVVFSGARICNCDSFFDGLISDACFVDGISSFEAVFDGISDVDFVCDRIRDDGLFSDSFIDNIEEPPCC